MLSRLSHCVKYALSFGGLLFTCALSAQVVLLPQKNLSRWKIPTANYSGITPIGHERYALVSDKEHTDGFYTFVIAQNAITGEVEQVTNEGFKGNTHPQLNESGVSLRDTEGIAYFLKDNTLFISGEGDQEIWEYNMDGIPTGRKLAVPDAFSIRHIAPNLGFEALCYDAHYQRFWTTTESGLLDDRNAGYWSPYGPHFLRLQSFNNDLVPTEQLAYRTDAGWSTAPAKEYVYGVSGMCALPDGRLIIMEREIRVPESYIGATTMTKLFLVNPATATPMSNHVSFQHLLPSEWVKKELLCTFNTSFRIFHNDWANYEGICLGRKLADGRQTLLLVNDSQASYGKGPFHLKDYIKVIILPQSI